MPLSKARLDAKDERHTANRVWQRTGGTEKGKANRKIGRGLVFKGTHSDQAESVDASRAIPTAVVPENKSALAKPSFHPRIAIDGNLIQQKIHRAPPSRDVTPLVAIDQNGGLAHMTLTAIPWDFPDRYPLMGQAPRTLLPDNIDTRALDTVYRFSQTERNNVNVPAPARLGPDHNITYAIPFTGNRGALYPVPRNADGTVMDDEKRSASFRNLSGKTTVQYGPTGSTRIPVTCDRTVKPSAQGSDLVSNMSGNAISRPVYQSEDEAYRRQVAMKQNNMSPHERGPYKDWTNTVWRGWSFNPQDDKPLYTNPHSFNRYPWIHGLGHDGIYYDPSLLPHGDTGGTYGVYQQRNANDLVAMPILKRAGEYGNIRDGSKQKVQISIGADAAMAGPSLLEQHPYIIRTIGGDIMSDDVNEPKYDQEMLARRYFLGLTLSQRSGPFAPMNPEM